MTNILFAVLVGLATGILSGFGIGGGSLLMLWLTCGMGVSQRDAAGMNLLYFLACAPPALISHWKNQLIDKKAALFCILSGIPLSILGCVLAAQLDLSLIRRGFGVLLLWIGVRELFTKGDKTTKERKKKS